APRGKSDRDEHLVLELRVPDESIDCLLRRDDLAVDAVLPVILSVGRAHLGTPSAANPLIHLDKQKRKPFRPPPMLRLAGVRPDFPDKIARRVETALDDQGWRA